MEFRKATVKLDQADIEAAIREAVCRQGWACGEIAITCTPHQYNGPDTFSATVEVEPREYDHEQHDGPRMGAKDQCSSCKRPITFDGKCWDHDGEPKPRHPAIPLLHLSTIRNREGR